MGRANRRKVISAIEGSNGIISAISRRSGYSRAVIERFLKEDEHCKLLFQHEKEKVLDVAESKVIQAIYSNDDLNVSFRASTWYLQNQGRDRGYGDPLPPEQKETVINLNFCDKEGALK